MDGESLSGLPGTPRRAALLAVLRPGAVSTAGLWSLLWAPRGLCAPTTALYRDCSLERMNQPLTLSLTVACWVTETF